MVDKIDFSEYEEWQEELDNEKDFNEQKSFINKMNKNRVKDVKNSKKKYSNKVKKNIGYEE